MHHVPTIIHPFGQPSCPGTACPAATPGADRPPGRSAGAAVAALDVGVPGEGTGWRGGAVPSGTGGSFGVDFLHKYIEER